MYDNTALKMVALLSLISNGTKPIFIILKLGLSNIMIQYIGTDKHKYFAQKIAILFNNSGGLSAPYMNAALK